MMDPIIFESRIIEWRGPAPFYYAPLPDEAAEEIRKLAKFLSYGWGVIPVAARVKGVSFTTSLFPRDGTYLLPLKLKVRRAIEVTAGDVIEVAMEPGAQSG